MLTDNDVVTASGDDYGAVYLPSETARNHWPVVEEILETLDND